MWRGKTSKCVRVRVCVCTLRLTHHACCMAITLAKTGPSERHHQNKRRVCVCPVPSCDDDMVSDWTWIGRRTRTKTAECAFIQSVSATLRRHPAMCRRRRRQTNAVLCFYYRLSSSSSMYVVAQLLLLDYIALHWTDLGLRCCFRMAQR